MGSRGPRPAFSPPRMRARQGQRTEVPILLRGRVRPDRGRGLAHTSRRASSYETSGYFASVLDRQKDVSEIRSHGIIAAWQPVPLRSNTQRPGDSRVGNNLLFLPAPLAGFCCPPVPRSESATDLRPFSAGPVKTRPCQLEIPPSQLESLTESFVEQLSQVFRPQMSGCADVPKH